MRGEVLTLWLAVGAACAAGCGARVDVDRTEDDTGDDGGPSTDAPPGAEGDGPAVIDAPLGMWGASAPIGTAATAGLAEDDPAASADETELVFAGKLGSAAKDIYRLTRADPTQPWGVAAPVAELNTTATEQTPRITADGTRLYFSTSRGGGEGGDDIWTATRANAASAWTGLAPVPIVNSDDDERTLTPCAGDRYLMISFRSGNGDVYEGVLGGAAPVLVAELSTGEAETGTFISADCREAWFASTRDGDNDIFYAQRAAVGDPWTLVGKVTELSTDGAGESDPWVSPDGHRMVYASNADGDNDLYLTTR
jgi:hypothetical protein